MSDPGFTLWRTKLHRPPVTNTLVQRPQLFEQLNSGLNRWLTLVCAPAGFGKTTTALKGREKWMIAILMIVFALGGNSYGMAEESLAFYGLIIAVMIAAGYDTLTGVSVVMLGAGIGVLASAVNPFDTGIASGFAGVSIADGLASRIIILVIALVIGLARGISVIMTNGLIIDTILYWAESAVSGLGGLAFINLVQLLYPPLGFLIPSSSGLATVSMPIMAPLADSAGVDRVTAYQSASGLLKIVNPTFAVVMGGLALGRVRYDKWLRFAFPLLILLLLLYAVVLSIGVFFPDSIIF